MRAGLGTYTGKAHLVFNQSRLLTWQDCQRQHAYRYIDNLRSDRKVEALTIGTAWHELLEAASTGQPTEPVLDAVEHDGWREWLERALDAWRVRYEDGSPTGETIAVEQDFWLEFEVRRSNGMRMPVAMLGRFDKLGRRWGELIVGEVKTVAKGTDFTTWFEMREPHPQHVGYGLAGALLARQEEFREEHRLDKRSAKLVYDIARKDPWPVMASKNGTVEERREQWERGLLHTREYPLSVDFLASAALLREVAAYVDGFHGRSRSRNSCLWPSGGRRCAFYDLCYHRNSAGLVEREHDYVDEAACHDQ